MYFGAEQSITNEIRVDVAKEKPTVYDVMLEVVKKVTKGGVDGVSGFTFEPLFPSPEETLSSITIQYTEAPKDP